VGYYLSMRYTVDGTPFTSFTAAVAAASRTQSRVVETATGLTRWSPAPPVSTRRLAYYHERLAAHEAGKRVAR